MARDLNPGDLIITADNTAIVSRTVQSNHHDFVYNFTVANHNNYFVGKQQLWVHNVKAEKCGDGDLTGRNWTFDSTKDVDLRGTGASYRDALDIAFEKTSLSKDEFKVTKWGLDQNGKSIPVEYTGPNGANVNIDIPFLNNIKRDGSLGEGPHQPHIGYQTPGKGNSRVRGHIFVDAVPATRR